MPPVILLKRACDEDLSIGPLRHINIRLLHIHIATDINISTKMTDLWLLAGFCRDQTALSGAWALLRESHLTNCHLGLKMSFSVSSKFWAQTSSQFALFFALAAVGCCTVLIVDRALPQSGLVESCWRWCHPHHGRCHPRHCSSPTPPPQPGHWLEPLFAEWKVFHKDRSTGDNRRQRKRDRQADRQNEWTKIFYFLFSCLRQKNPDIRNDVAPQHKDCDRSAVSPESRKWVALNENF